MGNWPQAPQWTFTEVAQSAGPQGYRRTYLTPKCLQQIPLKKSQLTRNDFCMQRTIVNTEMIAVEAATFSIAHALHGGFDTGS